MMNPTSQQLHAQIVDHIQRNGIEVVESPFEREWQPGPISRLIIALWRTFRNVGTQPHPQLAKDERMV